MTPLLDREKIRTILSQRFAEETIDSLRELPAPEQMHNLHKAASKIVAVIKEGRPVTIVGDYDVDGVVATAILEDYLLHLGAKPEVVIPNRFTHGYGLSPRVLEEVSGELIVTVDNGIAAHEAAQLCREKGLELIITDHHELQGGLPACYCVVNPKQPECAFPYPNISGAQVAWYLVAAIKAEWGDLFDLRNYLEWVAIAIISDVMPLKNINRVMLKSGLERFRRSERPAMLYLREICYGVLDESFLAYTVAPLLNSAGRMGDAIRALRFLSASTFTEAAERYAVLQQCNAERKEIERLVTEEAIDSAREVGDVRLAIGEGWHEGVLGIVASRLAEHFQRDSVVLTKQEGTLKGSARAYGDNDLFTKLHACRSCFTKFGGHQAAAGLLLEAGKLSDFEVLLAAQEQHSSAEEVWPEGFLGELDVRLVDYELLEVLHHYSPYGEQNPAPLFRFSGLEVLDSRPMGKEKNHLSLWFDQGEGKKLKGVVFYENRRFKKGEQVSCLACLETETRHNQVLPKLMIREFL